MIVINLPAKSWEQLANLVQSHIVNHAHREIGRSQLQHVRLDVPPHLASACPAEYAPLIAWLTDAGLNFLVFGSRRTDARLEIK